MLSKRLLEIANMIDTKNIYDVGCDHALLDIYLTKYKNTNCIAIDISYKNVEKAKENILKNNLNIQLLQNNGLDNIEIIDDSTVILSGLGTKTILEIINKKKINKLIIQSNNSLYDLRSKMSKLGYIIIDENLLYDKKYYITIKFIRGKQNYSEKELYLGPILLKKHNQYKTNYYDFLYKIFNNISKTSDKKFLLNQRICKYIESTKKQEI